MDEHNRFSLVFTKLRSILDEDGRAKQEWQEIGVSPTLEVTQAELDEIESLRRIVLEVTDPTPMSFTTT